MNRALNEQLVALMQEQLNRRQDDALLAFKPHKKQQVFIDDVLNGRVREAWALYANRAGKTEMGAFIDAYLCRFGWPDPSTIYHDNGIEVRDRAVSAGAQPPQHSAYGFRGRRRSRRLHRQRRANRPEVHTPCLNPFRSRL